MRVPNTLQKTFAATAVFLRALLADGENFLPVKEDHLLFLPGSQPGSVDLESAAMCDNCHGGYNHAVEPAYNWRGSMMASAARDPLWLACLTTALQDSIWVLGTPNIGDLCIRCHSPGGWLGGRSDPVNLTLLTGSDFEGVSCDACHKLLDPIPALRQSRDLPPETASIAIAEADKTFIQDLNALSPLTLFNGAFFLNGDTQLPAYFGDGVLPNFVEATSGEFFLDSVRPKRGPRYDAHPSGRHTWYYSRFHKTKYSCGTCHDVSNPVLARLLSKDLDLPEKQAAATYYHVERTFSEFILSAYGRLGGSEANPSIELPAGAIVATCQDCHMRDVTGKAARQARTARRTDLALHDQTGGNSWISGILASVDQTSPVYDAYNYAILSGEKFPAARIDVAGIQTYGTALKDGQARALKQLQVAADLLTITDTSAKLTLRIVNNTGHKLISGFPEGRRMWLNVRFYNNREQLIGEVNPYTPLVVATDASGNKQYVSGGTLAQTRDDLVYEAGLASTITDEQATFHFALGTHLYKDNRIPPKGFQIEGASARLVVPRWKAADAPNYFTVEEYAGGYDEVTLEKPAGTVRWHAALYYQTTSNKYIEFLRNEIEGTLATLPPEAYIAKTDPYFSTLKDWGKAIYDLWLHNDGCPPVLMKTLASSTVSEREAAFLGAQ